MSVSFSPERLVPAEDKVVLNILLNCELTKSPKTKQIHFQSLPTTPLEIKKKIEEDLSIPSCVQTLHYQSMVLKDSDQLQHTHFRSGDTFTVDYPIEAECEVIQNIVKWLKELLDLLRSVKENLSSSNQGSSDSMSSNFQKIEDLVMEGEADNTREALTDTTGIFFPWEDKKTLVNLSYFHDKGGLDVLMKVYGILVSKEWGDLGINKEFHIHLENVCCTAVSRYSATFPHRRQVIQLGGLEMCTTTLLRSKVQEGKKLPTIYCETIFTALYAVCDLSELPECQVPLALRTDVIDQVLAIACCSDDFLVSVNMVMCLAQSPSAHPYLVRTKVIEDLLKIVALREKITSEQPENNSGAFKALLCYTCTALAQIGLGSPALFYSIPLHLRQQMLDLMSTLLETVPPDDLRCYEEKVRVVWGTFLPFVQFLYQPATKKALELSDGVSDEMRHNVHIHCCNVLLHGLENALGRELHLEILVKERLLDYTMCLPAVLPGECQPRARSLVNELGKHRQLQPPSLCTLAKAHIAKIFCGLQPVMEMNSIGEFLHNFHNFLC